MDMSDITAKEMPHSIEAEQTVLGAILIDNDQISVAMELLKPECFFVTKHRQLYEIMVSLFSNNTGADIITVIDQAIRDGIFEDSRSGKEYLAAITSGVPTLTNLRSYCEIIVQKYYIRTLMNVSREIVDECLESGETAEVLLDSAEQKIYGIRQGSEISGLVKIEEALAPAIDHLQNISGADKEKYQGAKTGYTALDRVITGLNKSDLLILAARPGMGKTSFALNLITNVCRHSGKTAVIFSLEMSNEQLVTRMLSAESFVDSGHLMKGEISLDEWTKISEGTDILSRMHIYLDDTAGITVPQMKAKLRRLSGVDLVVIDYLQLMNSGRRNDNRVNEISEITRQLKLMAKELNVPIITLSQLSRSVESRPDKRPLLSDLRESGSIEQDADIVMFLYRDGYYNKEKSADINLAECIVAKNRHGETGTVNLRWNGQYTRFLPETNVPVSSAQ